MTVARAMRRLARSAWLRALLALALCLVAVPGTLPAGRGVAAAPVGSVFDAEAAAAKQRGRDIADDFVRVLFCTSCGYQQSFVQVKGFLEDKYPHLVDRVYGANYDVSPLRQIAAQAVGYAQIACMILMVFGEYLLPTIGVTGNALRWALDNRLMAFGVVLLMGSVAQSLTSSGAFEIYFNDELIFSKLQTGRWPTLQELSASLAAFGLEDLAA